MRARIASLTLPLIVLAGLRRCPQMHVDCTGCKAEADLTGTLILASALVVAAVAVYFFSTRKRGASSL